MGLICSSIISLLLQLNIPCLVELSAPLQRSWINGRGMQNLLPVPITAGLNIRSGFVTLLPVWSLSRNGVSQVCSMMFLCILPFSLCGLCTEEGSSPYLPRRCLWTFCQRSSISKIKKYHFDIEFLWWFYSPRDSPPDSLQIGRLYLADWRVHYGKFWTEKWFSLRVSSKLLPTGIWNSLFARHQFADYFYEWAKDATQILVWQSCFSSVYDLLKH